MMRFQWEKIVSKLKPAARARGDTIVEVMISMTVLAVVVAATYALANKAFQGGVNSQYRDQAVNLAQQQLELLKEADNNLPATITNYQPDNTSPFCISPNTKNVQTGTNDMFAAASPGCEVNNLFTVNVVYDKTVRTYHVVTKWDSAAGHTEQTDLYFKPSNSFTGSPRSCAPPNPDPDLCAPLLTNVPAIVVTLNSPSTGTPVTQVNAGDKVVVGWGSTNVNLSTCQAPAGTNLNPGGFAGTNVTSDSGSYTTSALADGGSYTFKVTCNDNAGHPVTGSAPLDVESPSPIPKTGSATSIGTNSAQLNGNVNPNGVAVTGCGFYYGTSSYANYLTSAPTYGTGVGCDQAPSSFGSTSSSPGPAASHAISGLSSGTTYHFVLCAVNSLGQYACGKDSSFTTATPPPLPSINYFYYKPNPPVENATIYLYWSSSNAVNCNLTGWGGYINDSNVGTQSPNNGFYGPNYHPLNHYSLDLTCYDSAGHSASSSVSPH